MGVPEPLSPKPPSEATPSPKQNDATDDKNKEEKKDEKDEKKDEKKEGKKEEKKEDKKEDRKEDRSKPNGDRVLSHCDIFPSGVKEKFSS